MRAWTKYLSLLSFLGLSACQSATLPETGFEQSFQPGLSRQKVADAGTLSNNENDFILQTILAKQEELGLCPFSFNEEQSKQWSELHRTDDNIYLAQILCFNAAYQGSFEFARVDTSQSPMKVEPLSLSLAGYPSYDPKTQILTNGYKFRGIGDCIEETEHRWNGEDLLLLTSTLQEALPNSCDAFQGGESYVVAPEKVGQAQLGMTLGQLKTVMGYDASFLPLHFWLDAGSGIRVSHHGEVLYDIGFVEPVATDDSQIISIQVRNPAFKTAEGIGPGTVLKDAIAAYGKATLEQNAENEDREYITFEQGLPENVLFRSNQSALDGSAGVYDENSSRIGSLRQTVSFKDKAAIGAITIVSPRR